MRIKKINVPIYDYNLVYIDQFKEDDAEKIFKIITKGLNKEQKELLAIKDDIKEGHKNGAVTIDSGLKTIYVIIHPCDTPQRMLNVVSHELYHVIQFICKDLNIKDIEAPAYLAGYIYEKVLGLWIKQ